MRRLMAIVLGVGFFCAFAFLYAATAASIPKATKAATVVRVTKMRAAGVVTEISDTALKIERKVKD